MVTPAVQHEIEQFLYHEAHLLDGRKFRDWLGLFSDTVHYWMPVRENRSTAIADSDELGPDDLAFFDDDKTSLTQRVNRLFTGMAWAEDPPSRTRHLVTNVRIQGQSSLKYQVTSSVVVYRSRLEREVDLFVGEREDIIYRTRANGWLIARRKITLDQAVLGSKNLSVFF